MKIIIFGATGNVGSRVVVEALSRGHSVTAVVRDRANVDKLPTGCVMRIGDAGNANEVASLSSGTDVVINATRSATSQVHEIVTTTTALIEGITDSSARLLVIGGAATLTVPDSGGKTVMEDENFLPVSARHIGRASVAQYEICLSETRVDWAYLSPPAQLLPGNRTGRYRIGSDELLIDFEGNSKISIEDLAVALMDEAEAPQHHHCRFTVAY